MSDSMFPSFGSLAAKVWYWSVIRGVIMVIIGVIALMNPVRTALSLALFLGIVVVIDGIVGIVQGMRSRGAPGSRSRIGMGVLTTLIGAILAVWPAATTTVVVYILAAWGIVIGLVQIVAALRLRSVSPNSWGWGLFVGVMTIGFGLLVIARPSAGIASIMLIVGIYAIIVGVVFIALGCAIRALSKATPAGPVIIENNH